MVKINTERQTDAKQIREMFAQRLKEIREERGLSQEDVGRMAGLSKATISKYEAASHPPKLIHAAAIAEALNVGFSYLTGFTDNRYVQETSIITELFLSLPDDGKKELLNYARYLEERDAKN
ncbi:MAG: helix-turn-helix domain-containing protein [Syntrophomonadaceae bacterium]